MALVTLTILARGWEQGGPVTVPNDECTGQNRNKSCYCSATKCDSTDVTVVLCSAGGAELKLMAIFRYKTVSGELRSCVCISKEAQMIK